MEKTSNLRASTSVPADAKMEQQSSSAKRIICGIDFGYDQHRATEVYEDDVGVTSDGLLDSSQWKSVEEFVLYPSKGLIARKFSSPELQLQLPSLPTHVTEGPDGFPLVQLIGSKNYVSSTRLVTEYFYSCRINMLRNSKKKNVSDCCIAVPIHFSYQQRREVLRAVETARLIPHRLLHDTTAAALAYRFSCRNDVELFNVVFIDGGHWSMQVSIVELQKDQLKVLSHAHDNTLGGRSFDQVLFDHFSAKFKVDTSRMSHNSLRALQQSCKELKEKLSTNIEAEFTFDTYKSVISRVEFEKLNSTQLDRVKVVLQQALNEARLAIEDVHSVELVGNGLKMPAIFNRVENFFGKKPRITEMIKCYPNAKGCVIQCALLCLAASNLPKFQIIDILPYSIGVDDMLEKLVVFPKGCPLPSKKTVIFLRSGTFFLDLLYSYPNDSQGSSDRSSYMIGPIQSRASLMEVNVTVQVDLNGISTIESANMENIIIPVVEYSCARSHSKHFENLTREEIKTTFRDKVQKAEKELIDISMLLKSNLNMETNRRIEIEKTLQVERIIQQNLWKTLAAAELQHANCQTDLATTIKQNEEHENEIHQKAEKQLVNISDQLQTARNSLAAEINKRTELEKTLRISRTSGAALECQLQDLKNSLNVETRRRSECEIQLANCRVVLESARMQQANLQLEIDNVLQERDNASQLFADQLVLADEARSAVERELAETKALLEATKRLEEGLQIEKENILKERDNALKEIEELHRMNAQLSSSTDVVVNFTKEEIEEATNNFNSSLKIGEGGYGSVYKGFLRQKTVAIKILSQDSLQGDPEFKQEVEILSKVRHPNIITLIGACVEIRALIYEYLPNGNLEAYLDKRNNTLKFSSWKIRISMASEICSALVFLHSSKPHGISHGDLKPENILLDPNYVTKLSDFGISRHLHMYDKTFTPYHPTLSPRGTFAYMDPEYLQTGEMTPYYDVYSFGIILLQFVTSRFNPIGIRKFVEEGQMKWGLGVIIDSSACNWPVEEARKMISLGLQCSDPVRKNRPDLATYVWGVIQSMKNAAGLDYI